MKSGIKQIFGKTFLASAVFFLSFGLAFAQATDFRSSGGSSTGGLESPQGVSNCEGGEVHDDGVPENGYGWNAQLVTDGVYVDAFSPGVDFNYTEVCVCWLRTGDDSTLDYELEVWDNSGSGGTPGVLLGSVSETASGVPSGIPGAFYSVDISSLNLDVAAGDTVFIGTRWDPSDDRGFFICSDESAGTPVNGGYAWNDNDEIWVANQDHHPAYKALMIRADGVESGSGPVEGKTRATFAVSKIFSDGNPGEVNVSIDCNTGLVLDQSKSIAAGSGVEFVVTDFTDGTLNCKITEDLTAGYLPSYNNGTVSNAISCNYTGVENGDANQCTITNTPQAVNIEVKKSWVIEGSNNDVNLDYSVYGYCDGNYIGSQSGEGPSDDHFTFSYVPAYPSSSCQISEQTHDSSIEVDRGACGSLTISAGKGASCAITNTVFFEGIPTLSQYGMAIMALLMLGVGFVGFRRHA